MKHPTADRRQGFTLIELLIVVVIIGILAAIAIPRFSEVRERAYRSAMMSDLKNLAVQQEIYHNTSFTFSSDQDDLGFTESEGVSVQINEADGDGWAAQATHQGAPSESCGMYHGDASPANGAPATEESLIQCTF